MAGFLTQFSRDLRDDYEIHKSDSFLMQYLRQERAGENGKKPGGAAARLEAAYAQASDAAGRRAYLLEALSVLEKSNKPLLQRAPESVQTPEPDQTPGPGQTPEPGQTPGPGQMPERVQTPGPGRQPAPIAKERLLNYAKSTGSPALAGAARWDKKACRALLAHLQAHEAPPPDAALIDTLHAELRESLLRREAEDYLYNLESGRKQSRDLLILEAYLDRHYNRYAGEDDGEAGDDKNAGSDGRRTGTALGAYYVKSGAGAHRPAWTGEELENAQRFFEALQDREYDYIWMPVEIDPRTGAGVYFIGMGRLLQVEIGQKGSGDHCRIARLYLQELDPQADEYGNTVLPMWMGSRGELEDLCDYPNVKEGLTWHRRLLEAGGAQSPLSEFQNGNGSPPPECPPEFLCYFTAPAAYAPSDLDAARQVGRSSFAREEMPLRRH